MKIILLVLILLISGCSNSLTLNINNVQSINYNNINLIEDDFNEIVNKINLLEFKEEDIRDVMSNELKIVTNEKIYNFKLSKDIIYYEDDNKTYISENNNLDDILNDIELKYTDFSFIEINYDKCNIKDNSTLIKIDNTTNCLILKTSKILYNFKINSVMSINEEIVENALLYQKDEIKSNEVFIKLNILGNPKTKISFETEYGYIISILPVYNENNLELNISNIQKK